MDTSKQAYLSPATGVLEITVVRDSRPYVAITLDLGIPNFTVFSLKLPLVQDKPSTMSTLVAEAVHALLDEMAAFMLSSGYDEEVIVQTYAAVLACYKGMSNETDSNKSMSPASKDPTIKSYEGSFKLPMAFINETYEHVVTAKKAGKVINVGPKTRHLELVYEKPSRVTPDDTAKVIRQYRNRSLKSQPNPLYIVVYDQMGKPKATIPLGNDFKNKLLKVVYKKGSATPEFSSSVKFNNDIEMKMTNVVGIPQAISVGEVEFTPEAYVGDDMALYHGQGGFLVKFSDGRVVPFTDRPSIQKLRATNFPVPSSYPNRWIIIREDEKQVNKAVDAEGNEINKADAEGQTNNTDPLPTQPMEPTHHTGAAMGDCFADCWKAISSGQAPGMPQPLSKADNVKLVHGLVNLNTGQRGDHAWIEFGTGKWGFVWEPQSKRVLPKDKFYEALKPQIEAAYPEEEALALGVKSGHSGPWHKEARKSPQEILARAKEIFLAALGKISTDAMKCSECGRVFSKEENHLQTCPDCGADVFWSGSGQGASGVLPVCTATGRICLAWRSPEVHQGNCWGTLGGAIKDNDTPLESALKEMKEEVGYTGRITLHPAYVFTSGEFKYHNFIGEVGDEFSFKPQEKHAWETEGIQWFIYEEILEMMKLDKSQFHSGLIALFEHSGDLIRQIAENKGNKPTEAS